MRGCVNASRLRTFGLHGLHVNGKTESADGTGPFNKQPTSKC